VKENGYWESAVEAYAIHETDEYWDNFQANVNPIPAEAFIDSWVGDRAVDAIQSSSSDQPFFLFVGLPNPHMPFDCPEPYASMYDPANMPIPETFGISFDDKPPIQAAFKRGGRRVNYEKMDEAKLRQAMAYYYGAVTLVDDQVGKIVAEVRNQGIEDQTVIAFCSDNGELLGHYGMLTKSIDEYPILYDVGLRVPMAIGGAGISPSVVGEPVELIDLCPTLLAAAGLEVAPEIQGLDLSDTFNGRRPDFRPYVFAESGAVKMIRSERYKLVHYPGQAYGELYDVAEDPDETKNMYGDPSFADPKGEMTAALLDRLIHVEGARHGESKGGRRIGGICTRRRSSRPSLAEIEGIRPSLDTPFAASQRLRALGMNGVYGNRSTCPHNLSLQAVDPSQVSSEDQFFSFCSQVQTLDGAFDLDGAVFRQV